MRRAIPRSVIVVAAILLLCAPPARADGLGAYELDPKGKVKAVRAIDVDGDKRLDLVMLVEVRRGDATGTDLVIARTPATPDAASYFPASRVSRLACSGPETGDRATAGAVALGRFGEQHDVLLRFLGASHVIDETLDGTAADTLHPRRTDLLPTTLLGRSADSALEFWDGVADLDGDGVDECWFPGADGHMSIASAPLLAQAGPDIPLEESASSGGAEFVQHTIRIPTLVAADVDGDKKKELIGLVGTELTVWRRDGAAMSVMGRVTLPFLQPDPKRPPEVIRAPRITLADVDGDGKVDLLVTLVQGHSDRVGGLRTSLFHYPGPLVTGPETRALPPPKSRIDTESVGLHPRFVDVDGDGRLDYVADSIRGTLMDLIQNAMGKDPNITFTVFRFDPEKGAYEKTPYATFERLYSGAEARGNKFGRSGFFEGDFDGDGRADLLDLGDLKGFQVSKGAAGASVAAGGRASFDQVLLARVATPKRLVGDAVIADLDGDKKSEAVVWTEDRVYVISARGAR